MPYTLINYAHIIRNHVRNNFHISHCFKIAHFLTDYCFSDSKKQTLQVLKQFQISFSSVTKMPSVTRFGAHLLVEEHTISKST